MKPIVNRLFAVLLLATFSVWVGCSHSNPPMITDLQSELTEKENEIRQLASANSEKDRQLKAYEAKINQTSTTQSSPVASLYPPDANPGECFARVFVPPTYKNVTEQVLTHSASERVEIIPAQYAWVEEKVMVTAASERIEVTPAKYGWVEEKVLVKAATTRLEKLPAKYEWVEEKILAKEAHVVWKKGRGPIEKVDDTTGEILCLVEVPASYKTVKKIVMVNTPGTREVAIPAEYQTVKKRVMLEPPKERTISIPAEYKTVKVRKVVTPPQEKKIPVAEKYQTVTKTVKTDDGRMEWRRIMCETNVTPDVVTRIQTVLYNDGYETGPIDGKLGRQTMSAVKSYQRDNNLAVGGLTYETIKKMSISL
jgi:Putative peptidoglycan binding domain